MVLNSSGEQVQVDDSAISICNHCDCEQKDDCKRFDKSVLACYNYEEIRKYYNCFIRKGDVVV